MNGRADARRFTAIFEHVSRCLRAYFRDDNDRDQTEVAYRTALADLPIDTVEMAGQLLAKEGTSDGRFPSAPEWVDVALRIQLELLVREQRKALPAGDASAEYRCADAARIALVAEARRLEKAGSKSAGYVAAFFEAYRQRPPTEYARQVCCTECSDTGVRLGTDRMTSQECDCRRTNPAIRLRAMKAAVSARERSRLELAAARAPSRAAALLSSS